MVQRTATKWIKSLWVVALMLLGTNVAHAETTQEIAKRAFRSTVLLVMEDANGQPLSLGSGFIVREGQIATNLHVVEGAAKGYAKRVGQKTKYNIEGITAVDLKRDLVILKLSTPSVQPLSLGNSDAVQVGESVYAVGNPQGLEGTFSQGIVSGIRDIDTDKLLQITAPLSPGSSGGPVLNTQGEVIGVSVATYLGGQNLNFAIPSDYLKTLLGKIGPVKPLAQTKSAKAKGSILEDLGGRISEGVVVAQLMWDMPMNQFSGRYSFSLRNQLKEPVKNVNCLLIFQDSKGNTLDVDLVQFSDVIPAGLARRVPSEVHPSIGVLTNWNGSAVQYRILDFEIVD